MHPAELIDSLEMSASVLERFVRQIPEDKMDRKRGDGIWTVYEHLHHLTLVQPVMYKRFRMFKNEEAPVIQAYFPDAREEKERTQKRTVDELIATFKDWRAKQVELTVYPEAGHDAWTATYDNPKLYDWLLSHRRAE